MILNFIQNEGSIKEHCSPLVGNWTNISNYIKMINESKVIDYTIAPLAFVNELKMGYFIQNYCRWLNLCLRTAQGPMKMNSLPYFLIGYLV